MCALYEQLHRRAKTRREKQGGKKQKLKGRKTICNCLKVHALDIGEEELPVNAILELTKQDDKGNPNHQTPCH